VHNGEDEGMTDGQRPLEHSAFFARLAQRAIHLLTTQTHSGIAYPVDTQLRPSGQSGLIVTEVEAFRAYQLERAWTWEHQALVRARAITGDLALRARFEAVRQEVLTRPRDPEKLLADVRSMRQRMRENLGVHKVGVFDLKHGDGGITDIEFIVQYRVLRDASRFPELVRYSDNIRQLEALSACELLSAAEASALATCYRAYRSRLHQMKLQEQEAVVPDVEFMKERDTVHRLWRRFMEESPVR
jgi:glutamate-ammonia-ligase adenylyltransferase